MTNTYYTLANGTIVKTYAEALKSGQKYTMCYEPVAEVGVDASKELREKRINGILKRKNS